MPNIAHIHGRNSQNFDASRAIFGSLPEIAFKGFQSLLCKGTRAWSEGYQSYLWKFPKDTYVNSSDLALESYQS